MRKYFLISLVLISVLSFGQRKEYNKAGKLFLNKEYAAANEIIEKILVDYNIDKLDIELKYYILTVASDSNYNLNHYEKALNYYNELKKIVVDGKIEVQDKKTFISHIDKLTEDLQGKIKKEGIISENNSNDNTTASLDNGTKLVATKSMSDDKTVTLTVTGTGKTIEEAKQNALRSAIEQAFGTFISSKTEILNDNLVKDEIVSVSNGNIQKFDVISEVQVPDVGYATTLNATVSISKLTSFVESKGFITDFKGSLFAINVKNQILNENNEQKSIAELVQIIKQVYDSSIDYTILPETPISLDSSNQRWKIRLNINASFNNNILNAGEYLFKTLNSISLSIDEVNNYTRLNKKTYSISIASSKNSFNYIILRKEESFNMITELINYFDSSLTDFKISNEIETIESKNGIGTNLFTNVKLYDLLTDVEKTNLDTQIANRGAYGKETELKYKTDDNWKYKGVSKIISSNEIFYTEGDIPTIVDQRRYYGKNPFQGRLGRNAIFTENKDYNFLYKLLKKMNFKEEKESYDDGMSFKEISFKVYYPGLVITFIPFNNKLNYSFHYNDIKSLDEINKIAEYKISKK